jgi:hypothetical protein
MGGNANALITWRQTDIRNQERPSPIPRRGPLTCCLSLVAGADDERATVRLRAGQFHLERMRAGARA